MLPGRRKPLSLPPCEYRDAGDNTSAFSRQKTVCSGNPVADFFCGRSQSETGQHPLRKQLRPSACAAPDTRPGQRS